MDFSGIGEDGLLAFFHECFSGASFSVADEIAPAVQRAFLASRIAQRKTLDLERFEMAVRHVAAGLEGASYEDIVGAWRGGADPAPGGGGGSSGTADGGGDGGVG